MSILIAGLIPDLIKGILVEFIGGVLLISTVTGDAPIGVIRREVS